MHSAHEHLKNIYGGFFDRHPHLVQFLGDLLYVFLLILMSTVLAVIASDKLDEKNLNEGLTGTYQIDVNTLDLHI
jgi:hypothetical protein